MLSVDTHDEQILRDCDFFRLEEKCPGESRATKDGIDRQAVEPRVRVGLYPSQPECNRVQGQ